MRHRGLQIFNLNHLNLLGSSASFNLLFILHLCLMHTTVAIRKPYIFYQSFSLSSDVNVRVTVLTLYGALVTTQAPLPEVQLLLQQPEGSTCAGSSTPGGSDWRQRDNLSSPAQKPVTSSQQGSCTHSPGVPQTPAEDGSFPWLMQLCASLITQPREDHSDSEGATQTGSLVLEPLPVRLEALQVSWWTSGTK